MDFDFGHLEALCRLARMKDKELPYMDFVPHLADRPADLAREGYVDMRLDSTGYDAEDAVPFYQINQKGLELAELLSATASLGRGVMDLKYLGARAEKSDPLNQGNA